MTNAIDLFPGVGDKHYFQNPETKEYWFHATSVCKQMGFENTSRTLMLYCDEDERFQEIFEGKAVWFISEAGVYGLAMVSKTEKAKEFKRWLKHDVLPKLRSEGTYTMSQTPLSELININSLLTCALVSGTPKSPELQELIEQNSPHLVADDWVEQPTYTEPIEESATNTWLDRAEDKFARLFAA
jgi:prophage antirepressor-like protein